MGRILHRKGESGIATTYISRKQALKKLQLSLKDFRRLCILKGIYPVEPSHKKKANKNNSTNKTYYYLKDVQFLAHEPLIDKFRNFKIYIRKLKKSVGKKDQETSKRLRENEPTYRLDHIVKERYPTFIDALRDLDDVLSMCFLFSTFPKDRVIRPELIHLCRRLIAEFQHYVIETRSLRKVFISIKGYYYQAEIMGQTITWMAPHFLGYSRPSDVDFKIMVTFALFYSTMLGFVNFKLYNSINLIYPPKLDVPVSDEELMEGDDDITEFIAALNLSLKSSVENNAEDEVQLDEFPEDDEDLKAHKISQEKLKKFQKLFCGCKIFLNREVPKESLVFIIRCFGGEVSYDKTVHVGATFDETDETITHQIVDRPNVNKQYMNRYYIQPQWVYDSINAMMLLPVDLYFTGVQLPPHLSPFVEEEVGDYIPPEKKALLDLQSDITKTVYKVEESSEEFSDEDSKEEKSDSSVGVIGSDDDSQWKKRKLEPEVMPPKAKVTPGKTFKEDPEKIAQREAAEEKRLAIMMMHKKDKHLYDKIVFGQKRKKREALKLKEKRDDYEQQAKRLKKKIK